MFHLSDHPPMRASGLPMHPRGRGKTLEGPDFNEEEERMRRFFLMERRRPVRNGGVRPSERSVFYGQTDFGCWMSCSRRLITGRRLVSEK